jgi:hypothetical protein
MHRTRILAIAATLTVTGAVAAWVGIQGDGSLPELVDEPVAEIGIEHAQRFELEESYTHFWREEAPGVRSGYILVLRVDPELARPRNSLMNVLYVGRQTAERVNHGYPSGRLVVLVPDLATANGVVPVDLESGPIWFGTPDLPERVDAARIEAERRAALERAVPPIPTHELQNALAVGGEPARARDRALLDFQLADLIKRHSPEETELAEGLQVPLNR